MNNKRFHSHHRGAVFASASVALLLAVFSSASAQGTNGLTARDSIVLQTFRAWLDSIARVRTTAPVPADSVILAQVDSLVRPLRPKPKSDPIRFNWLQAQQDLTRGVIAGGLVSLHLSRPPGGDTPSVEIFNLDTAARPVSFPLQILDIDTARLLIAVPDSVKNGTYRVEVYTGSARTLLERPHRLVVKSIWTLVWQALLPIVVLLGVIWWVMRKYNSLARGPGIGDGFVNQFTTFLLGPLQKLVLEPQNNTYSLSRAQFIFWTFITAFSYAFIFLAQGLVSNSWTFPGLTEVAWTFIISLGTLLVAQGTASAKGVKGAGEDQPSIADLFLHGGVVALERVQQVLWSLIAASIFIYVLIKNYASSSTIPVIPEQVLYLMGLSSAGYLVGKAIRNPGPVVKEVELIENGTKLSIKGDNLSSGAFIWADDLQLPGNATGVKFYPRKPATFATEVQIPLPAELASADIWFAEPRTIIIYNADGQRAEWKSTPRIVNVVPSATISNEWEITTNYLGEPASWVVNGVATQLERDPQKRTLWYYDASGVAAASPPSSPPGGAEVKMVQANIASGAEIRWPV